MDSPSFLQMLLVGAIALGVLFWFGPGAKRSLENTRKASGSEWMGALVPLGLVVLFVILLIALAQ